MEALVLLLCVQKQHIGGHQSVGPFIFVLSSVRRDVSSRLPESHQPLDVVSHSRPPSYGCQPRFLYIARISNTSILGTILVLTLALR